eukprot:4839843-Amphidinium_carterae.1
MRHGLMARNGASFSTGDPERSGETWHWEGLLAWTTWSHVAQARAVFDRIPVSRLASIVKVQGFNFDTEGRDIAYRCYDQSKRELGHSVGTVGVLHS